jgi:hypothetical protein
MPPVVYELVLAPNEAQAELLTETMTRVNVAAEAFAAAVFPAQPESGAALRGQVGADVLKKFKLPVVLRDIALESAAEALRRKAGKPKFGRSRALDLGFVVEWPLPDQARLPTVSGKRAIHTERDPSFGWVRSPLEKRPLSLERRGDRFVLVANDRPRDDDEE